MRFVLSGGNASDYSYALLLPEGQGAESVIADKGYDSDEIEEIGAEAVIPPRSHRNDQREYDRRLYEE
jgi:IS5 family transposase